MNYSGLPFHLQQGFQNYIERRIPMGSFGMAVLCNDLKDACACADDTNRYALFDIVSWLYNEAPSPCWGSPEKVSAWLNPEETEQQNRTMDERAK